MAAETYDEMRARLRDSHDTGASDALSDAMACNVEVDCMAYCYGGHPDPDYDEILADLAEAGWRLVRAVGGSHQ